jgi:hypothetical protein
MWIWIATLLAAFTDELLSGIRPTHGQGISLVIWPDGARIERVVDWEFFLALYAEHGHKIPLLGTEEAFGEHESAILYRDSSGNIKVVLFLFDSEWRENSEFSSPDPDYDPDMRQGWHPAYREEIHDEKAGLRMYWFQENFLNKDPATMGEYSFSEPEFKSFFPNRILVRHEVLKLLRLYLAAQEKADERRRHSRREVLPPDEGKQEWHAFWEYKQEIEEKAKENKDTFYEKLSKYFDTILEIDSHRGSVYEFRQRQWEVQDFDDEEDFNSKEFKDFCKKYDIDEEFLEEWKPDHETPSELQSYFESDEQFSLQELWDEIHAGRKNYRGSTSEQDKANGITGESTLEEEYEVEIKENSDSLPYWSVKVGEKIEGSSDHGTLAALDDTGVLYCLEEELEKDLSPLWVFPNPVPTMREVLGLDSPPQAWSLPLPRFLKQAHSIGIEIPRQMSLPFRPGP